MHAEHIRIFGGSTARRVIGALPALALLAACAGNPRPGETGYPFNVAGEYDAEFVASDGSTYHGSMRLTTAIGGTVTGSMEISDPMRIDGDVEGTLVENELALALSYDIPDFACAGTAAGSAAVGEGGSPVTGELETDGGCDAPPTISFTLVRSEP